MWLWWTGRDVACFKPPFFAWNTFPVKGVVDVTSAASCTCLIWIKSHLFQEKFDSTSQRTRTVLLKSLAKNNFLSHVADTYDEWRIICLCDFFALWRLPCREYMQLSGNYPFLGKLFYYAPVFACFVEWKRNPVLKVWCIVWYEVKSS